MKKHATNEPEGAMDLTAAVTQVWASRRTVLRIAAVVIVAGVALALLGEVRYTAGSVIAPQTGQAGAGGNITGLAAMAGINLSEAEQSGGISPKLYPMVVASVPFHKELMQLPVEVPGRPEPVTLIDYFTVPGLRRLPLLPLIGKYTVRLPWTVMNAMRRSREQSAPPRPEGVETLTAREYECIEQLKRRVTVKVDELEGYVALTASMPDALMAARVAQRAGELLEDYLTRFKVQKVQADLDFIDERYTEMKAEFEARQQALAEFRDANRDISSARARTRENRLENEYNLAFTLYSELASQREQARIRVKEDTPVFTVIEPVTVPVRKSAPRRALVVMISTVLGLCAGVGWALVAPAVRSVVAAAGRQTRPKKK